MGPPATRGSDGTGSGTGRSAHTPTAATTAATAATAARASAPVRPGSQRAPAQEAGSHRATHRCARRPRSGGSHALPARAARGGSSSSSSHHSGSAARAGSRRPAPGAARPASPAARPASRPAPARRRQDRRDVGLADLDVLRPAPPRRRPRGALAEPLEGAEPGAGAAGGGRGRVAHARDARNAPAARDSTREPPGDNGTGWGRTPVTAGALHTRPAHGARPVGPRPRLERGELSPGRPAPSPPCGPPRPPRPRAPPSPSGCRRGCRGRAGRGRPPGAPGRRGRRRAGTPTR